MYICRRKWLKIRLYTTDGACTAQERPNAREKPFKHLLNTPKRSTRKRCFFRVCTRVSAKVVPKVVPLLQRVTPTESEKKHKKRYFSHRVTPPIIFRPNENGIIIRHNELIYKQLCIYADFCQNTKVLPIYKHRITLYNHCTLPFFMISSNFSICLSFSTIVFSKIWISEVIFLSLEMPIFSCIFAKVL